MSEEQANPVVSLPPSVWSWCLRVGHKRHEKRLRDGAEKASMAKVGNRFFHNGYSVAAEYAVAKHYGDSFLRDWITNRAYSETPWVIPCDLGTRTQVRSTTHRNGGVVIQKYDQDDHVFILTHVDNRALIVTLLGWNTGAELKKAGEWQAHWPHPAFLAGRDCLLPIGTLPEKDL